MIGATDGARSSKEALGARVRPRRVAHRKCDRGEIEPEKEEGCDESMTHLMDEGCNTAAYMNSAHLLGEVRMPAPSSPLLRPLNPG